MASVISKILAFTLMGVSVASCSGSSAISPGFVLANEPSEIGWATVYFTDPNAPETEFLHGGPDEPLHAAIESARVSIEVAIYDLNLYNIRDALIAAQERGVQVRMVVEGDNFEAAELFQFNRAGIPVTVDGRSGSMHNKFLVIDRYEVWTGSMNFTLSEAYGNRNNLLRVRSTVLAENYLIEFEEMFNRQFGPSSPVNTPYPMVEINGRLVETYFSPEDGTLARIVTLLDEAQESLYFMAFSFTSDDLAAAIHRAQNRGVAIHGILDKAQALSNQGGEYRSLSADGIDVHLDGEGGSMHHKVLVIDEQIVVTGSYNFSASAERQNDENTLIIHDEKTAQEFLAEFWRLWEFVE